LRLCEKQNYLKKPTAGENIIPIKYILEGFVLKLIQRVYTKIWLSHVPEKPQ